MTTLTEEQRVRADSLPWYHAYDFGDYQTCGRISPPYPPNMTLFGVMDMLSGIDVRDRRVLEIGPAHGLISIGLAIRGARVTTCDIGGGKPPQIELAEEVFGVSLDYRHPVSLEKVPETFDPGSFDLIVCAGVMYHLLNPADVFFRLRPLLKTGGLLVMETVYAPDVEEPVLVLNSETGQFGQVTTYFLASAPALVGMAKLACFDVLATRLNSPSRYALTGRAVDPDGVSDRSDFLKKIHTFGFEDPMFNVKALAAAPETDIVYTGERGHRFIDVATHVPDFAPHPKAMTNVLGKPFG